MVEGISSVGGYDPPSYNALRGPLLQTAKAKVDSALDIWRGEGKRVTGFVLSSDGWEASAEGHSSLLSCQRQRECTLWRQSMHQVELHTILCRFGLLTIASHSL